MAKLLIVESPTKANTISRMLGKDYTIIASMGHVRNLPEHDLGVDIDKDFTPLYVDTPKSRSVVKRLRDAAKSADVAAPAAGNEIRVESDSVPVMADADISVADFAAKNNTTVEKIRQMNPDFSGDTIKKDMVVFVPGKRN